MLQHNSQFFEGTGYQCAPLPFEYSLYYYRPMIEQRSDSPPLKPMAPEELREWRKTRGLTQQQLADLLNISRQAITNWECGIRKIPPYLNFTLNCLEEKLLNKKHNY